MLSSMSKKFKMKSVLHIIKLLVVLQVFFCASSFAQEKFIYHDLYDTTKLYKITYRNHAPSGIFIDSSICLRNNGEIFFVKTDTFLAKNNSWRIKKFGAFQQFLGSSSFKKDSLILKDDRKIAIEFGDKVDTSYALTYLYYPLKRIKLRKCHFLYLFRVKTLIFDKIDCDEDVVFFDSKLGIVKYTSACGDSYFLKGYADFQKLIY